MGIMWAQQCTLDQSVVHSLHFWSHLGGCCMPHIARYCSCHHIAFAPEVSAYSNSTSRATGVGNLPATSAKVPVLDRQCLSAGVA